MTKLELLVELYEREKYNLSCYSADYLLQKAKKGFDAQYNEHPLGASLNINSPKVTTLAILFFLHLFKCFLYKEAAAYCRYFIESQKLVNITAVNPAGRNKLNLRERSGQSL